ncbi:MAG: ABC transporter ATP-binding protein, partial [Chlamydiota bacterium]|nr:ABC transporter ATP-binding protein [Chlamydiota bacterium]
SIVVTHEMKSAFRIAKRMIMMHGGKVVSEGDPESIRHSQDPLVRQFIEGEADGPIPLKRSGNEYMKALTG